MLKSMGKLFSKRKSSRHSHDSDHHHKHRHDTREDRHHAAMYAQGSGAVNGPVQHSPIHTDAVVSLSKVQPGICLSGSKDKTVVLYDYKSKKIEDRWTGHEREITKVKYGAICQGIFSASRDKSVKLWRRGNADAVREYLGHDLVVSALDLNQDNSRLCTGSRDNTVRLWDVETGQCLLQNNIHRNLVTDVKFVPESNMIVQTGEDKEVRIYDTRTLQVTHNFIRKQYIQMCCDVSRDGVHCLTCSNGFGGNGCEATLWDLRQKCIVQEYRGHSEAVESCMFLPFTSPDLIATSSRDCSVRIWDKNTKECIASCVVSGSGPLSSIICYEDGTMCVGSFNLGILQMKFSLSNQTLQHIASF